ncbi:DeoR/GlpR family DNA-binding transcription regulator [Halopseudomonas pelagia]|uniref:DeoR/GlpR family DNA-binding transcription regulator n=1 Tax=Halopseudomonas pelagia TaxID=553151 RepID=UPI00039C3071|nr:DeoR/GlpR family DNA-binding transcription regulator [Halopseudomonas pelagia]|tara:strand:- start:173 stop:931 length:759 start_codon:yes stop_codon:yes gene_type:complete
MSRAKTARQAEILAELNTTPSLRIADLAKLHQVSSETIRRDLDELTRSGHLNRTYGGAVRAIASEPAVTERHRLYMQEREQIARTAVDLMKDARILMIGSGSTTVHVARRIASVMKDITVITHSFGVATVLSINPTIRVIVLPGDYHAAEGAMVGAHTLAFLHSLSADYTVLGSSGLSTEGPTDALIDCAVVYSAMIQRAVNTIVVADHSKFDATFPARYASWQQVQYLVADQQPSGKLAAVLSQNKVAVRC